GQHAHVITGHPIHAGGTQRGTAEQVAAADHQPHLHADTDQLSHLQSHAVEHLGIDTEVLGTHQGLTAEFQKDAVVLGLTALWYRCHWSPSRCRARHSTSHPQAPGALTCSAFGRFFLKRRLLACTRSLPYYLLAVLP